MSMLVPIAWRRLKRSRPTHEVRRARPAETAPRDDRRKRAADRRFRPPQPDVVGHARLHGDRGMDAVTHHGGLSLSAAELRILATAPNAVSEPPDPDDQSRPDAGEHYPGAN